MAAGLLFSKVEQAATRFPDFVSELEGFFAQYGLPVGTPEALPALADRVSTGGAFRDDLVSMLHVLCVEEEQISYLELLGLLLVAALGMDRATDLALEAGAEEPVRRIFSFVVESRRPRPEMPDEANTVDFPEDNVTEPKGYAADDAKVYGESARNPELRSEVPLDNVRAEPRGSVLARALAIAADEDSFGPSKLAVPAPAREPVPVPVPLPVTAPARVQVVRPAPEVEEPLPIFAQHVPAGPVWRRVPAWAAGLGGVVLGLALGLLWPRHEAQPLPAGTSASSGATAGAAGGEQGLPRREGTTRIPPNDASVEVARTAGHAGDRAGELAASHAGSAGVRRNRDGTTDRATGASADRGAGGNAAPMSPAGRAVRLLPGAVVPSVRAVDLTAPADAANQEAHGAHTRLPSVVLGSSGIMAANLISAPTPPYPDQASAARVQGEVVVEAVVGRDGSVIETRVVSGPELLRQASLNAVQHWQFRPYKVDGAPSEIVTTARLQFRLNPE